MRVSMVAAAAAAASMTTVRAAEPGPSSIAEAQASARGGSSESMVRAFLDRIAAVDASGPALHSVVALNPQALAAARERDAERKAGRIRGRLHGVPILVKDNVETADPMATTAGSLALAGNVTGRDAPVVARLRAAGAVILGKTNLSEWANIRSSRSVSGWSGVGGLVKNPYVLDRNACGSSSGTGAAIAAGLAVAGVGTETDGSVTCPASMNGIVGIKPTVGLVSRTHIVPISHSQDTAGPMGRSVADVAALLTVMAGSDPADPATREADARKTDYLAALQGATLKGARLGVLRYASDVPPEEAAVFDAALAAMRAQGAEIVEIADYRPPESMGANEFTVMKVELKADLDAYLASTDPAKVKTRTLADVIAFNRATPRETALFAQETFDAAQETRGLSDPAYLKARADSLRAAGRDGVDRLMAQYRVDALIAPTTTAAWRTDVALGDHDIGEGATSLAAVAGYPHVTVPMGYVKELPVGLSIIAGAWQEARILRYAAAFEAATHARREPRFLPSLETAPAYAPSLAPVAGVRR